MLLPVACLAFSPQLDYPLREKYFALPSIKLSTARDSKRARSIVIKVHLELVGRASTNEYHADYTTLDEMVLNCYCPALFYGSIWQAETSRMPIDADYWLILGRCWAVIQLRYVTHPFTYELPRSLARDPSPRRCLRFGQTNLVSLCRCMRINWNGVSKRIGSAMKVIFLLLLLCFLWN